VNKRTIILVTRSAFPDAHTAVEAGAYRAAAEEAEARLKAIFRP
jgi:hypothetical protein